MAYLTYLVTLMLDTVNGFCVKKTSNSMQTSGDSMLFSLVRLTICLIIGLVAVAAEGAELLVRSELIAIAFASGVCTVTVLIFWLIALEYNPMVSLNTAASLGSIIPAVLCAVFFGQALVPMKLVGFVLIVSAACTLAGYKPDMLKQNRFLKWFSLAAIIVSNGLFSFCQQLYNRFCPEVPLSVYHFYSYAFSVVILFVILAVVQVRRGEKINTALVLKPLPYIVVLGCGLFGYNYLQTVLAAEFAVLPQVLYPALCGGSLITISVTAMLFFGEKPTRRSLVGTLLALAGIVTMHLF